MTIGEFILKLVGKTDGEVIDARHSLKNALSSLCSNSESEDPRCHVGSACLETKFDLNAVQMEVEGEDEKPTGRFRSKRSNDALKPAGNLPTHWIDPVHEGE